MLKFGSKIRKLTIFTSVIFALLFSTLSSAQAAGPVNRLTLDSPPLVIEVGGPGLGDYENTKTYTRQVNLRQGESGYLEYLVDGPLRATLSVEMILVR